MTTSHIGSGHNDVKIPTKAESQRSQYNRANLPLVYHAELPPMTRRAGHSAPVEGILAIEYDVTLSNRTHMDEKRRVYPVLRRVPMT
jgi:hypothetical protein